MHAGHTNLAVYNPRAPDLPFVHLHYTDGKGKFLIPFLWEGADIGDFLGTVFFRVFAVDRHSSAKGSASEKFYVRPDIQSLMSSLAIDLGSSGALDLKEFPLASAISTAFTPRLSAVDMVGFGGCEIWLE